MNIARIYLGFDENNVNPESLDEMISIIHVESNKKTAKGRPFKTTCLKENSASQMIKVPGNIKGLKKTSSIDYEKEIIDNVNDKDIILDVCSVNFESEGDKRNKGVNMEIKLNDFTLCPYVVESKTDGDKTYAYIILDTNALSLIRYEAPDSIIATFRYPKQNKLGCLIKLESDKDINFVTRDESSLSFKNFRVYLDSDGDVAVAFKSSFEKEELGNLRHIWNKKPRTRTFQFNAFSTGLPKLLIGTDDTCDIKVPNREEYSENYVEAVKNAIVEKNGFMPRAIKLVENFDLQYSEMIELRLTYVIGVNPEDGSVKTLKSN